LWKEIYVYCCAADAEIWAEQQLVPIPGWLLKYQNARLNQEGQLTSRKRPISLIIKKNKAKEELFTARRGGKRWQTLAIPLPPPPVATLGPGPADFRKTCGFVEKVADLRKKWWI
jgi:hypothetical protein